eukprot:TRINITY_DN7962_c0_g1_i1.p1 TRINITY_DN7962_c0_g1~~TRINITY_DN7962_c0_g1_i1.p1  ORF type:complete len:434 (-),score=-9.59 TRINITY_DN7962_c0_g1_i1:59-1360(-)
MDQIPAKSVAQSRGLIQLMKTKQELDAIDIAFLSEVVLVDTNYKEYNVHAIFQASQKRSLCEVSADGNSLYITSLDVTEELLAKYGVVSVPDAIWDVPTLRRLDLVTEKLHSVSEADCVDGVLSISLFQGVLAVNNYRTVILLPEHGKSIQIPEQRPVHHVSLCNLESHASKMLVIFSIGNGASYLVVDNLLSDSTLAEPRFFARNKLFAHCCTGKYNGRLYIFGATNNQSGPSVFLFNEQTQEIEAEENMLSYGESNITASMGSCQTNGPLFAMGTLDGRCFIWNVETRELVQVMYNLIDLLKKHNKIEIEAHRFANNGIMNVRFNPAPRLKHILAFAEASNYVHIVDTRTFKEQIIPIGKGNPISGLCFSHDGTKLYVATMRGVNVYDLYMRSSLLEHCTVFIMENLAKKDEYGWNISDLPTDLQRKLHMH